MGTEMEPVNGSTGMLWISSVAVVLMLCSCCFSDEIDFLYSIRNCLPGTLPGELFAYVHHPLQGAGGMGIKKALPINQKSFEFLC